MRTIFVRAPEGFEGRAVEKHPTWWYLSYRAIGSDHWSTFHTMRGSKLDLAEAERMVAWGVTYHEANAERAQEIRGQVALWGSE